MRILLLLLLISPWVLSEEPLGIGQLRVGMSVSDVISKMGAPASKKEQADYITDIYSYSNIEAYFNGEYLVGIYTETNGVCTPQGICPGNFLQSALSAYGKPHEKSVGVFEFYSELTDTCWYRIWVKNERIKSVEVACQP